MNARNYLLIFSIFCLNITRVDAQSNLIDTLTNRFNYFRENKLQEKIYAHVDQTLHLTGEILWFKLYVVDGSFHKPLGLSKVAYVEIVDQNNVPMLQDKISLSNGVGNGSFYLPPTLSSGNYQLRAYTSWMRNTHSDFFFHQTITIVNTFAQPELQAKKNSKVNVNFFPEGGNLVDGLQSRVAFHVYNQLGKGLVCKGWIGTSERDTVARFSTNQRGTGSFDFIPSVNNTHTAYIKDKDGYVTSYPLPKVFDKGYVMSVIDRGPDLEITVTGHSSYIDHSNFIYLFAHARQITVHGEGRLPDSRHRVIFRIKKQSLPDGIIHLTVFDHELHPVAERLFFRNPQNKLSIDVQTNQPRYTSRRKIKVEFKTFTGKSAEASNLSIAVYRDDSLKAPRQENIYDYLWLASDLSGSIDSLSFYTSDDPKSKEAMDLLMMTKGWRRFTWKDILARDAENSHPVEFREHIIHAKVTEADGTPAKGAMTYLASPDKIMRMQNASSNASGDVHFEVKEFRGSRDIVVQPNTLYDSVRQISIVSPYALQTTSHSFPPFVLDAKHHHSLLDRSVAMQVQSIYHSEKADRFLSIGIDSLAFYGKPDEIYFLDDYTRFPVMEEVMREYVPGVMVRKRRDGFEFLVLDRQNKGVLEGDPLMLIDGVPVFDADEIMAFDPRKVKKLEVVTRRYYLGTMGYAGVISYSTYGGDLGGFTLNPRAIKLNYDGLQLQREFFNPTYNNQNGNGRIPDQRQLLYWNPDVKTNDDGTAFIEFYASDLAGNFVISVQGLSVHGVPGSGSASFSVRQFDN
jgi:hypothetical protein